MPRYNTATPEGVLRDFVVAERAVEVFSLRAGSAAARSHRELLMEK